MKTNLFNTYFLLILLSAGACLISHKSNAQSRPLPILQTPLDARASSMGGASLTSTETNYLYTNPTSMLYQDTRLTVSALGILYPSYGGANGRLKNGTISAGYKLLDKHVLYAGFRYQGGLSYKITSSPFDSQESLEYNPFDWVADLGYAYKVSDEMALFGTASFIQSYTGRAAYAGTFAVGANYLTYLQMGQKDARLNISTRIADFGTRLYYSSSEKYIIPSRAELTTDIAVPMGQKFQIAALAAARYYFSPTNNQLLQGSLGVETTYDLFSLRGGVQLGTKSTSHWTCGAGIKFMGAAIDFAYLRGLNSIHSDRLMLTLSYNY